MTADWTSVPPLPRNIIALDTCLGLIGNGGFRWFYENDFDGGFRHADLAGCLQQCGHGHEAALCRRVEQIFTRLPLTSWRWLRNIYLSTLFNDESFFFIQRIGAAERALRQATPQILQQLEEMASTV